MSVYISNLPEYTGDTYNGYIVWNDSGETTTYKTKYLPPYVYNPITDGITETQPTSRTQLNTEGGSNTISGTGQRLVSGSGNTLGGTSTSQFVFGRNNTSNYTPAIGQTGSFVFGENNTASSGRWGVIMGFANNVGGGGSQAFGDNHNVSGGNSAVFGNSNTHSGNFGFAAGYANALSGDYTYSFGEDNDITSSSHSSILGGKGNDITNANGYSSLISSSASTITGGIRIVGLGLNGRTGLSQDNTTFTENTHAFRTYSTEVQSVVSGTTFTCNLNNGGKAQFYLTGASTIDITNVRDGQSFIIKTQSDGNYTITWTATGYTFVFEGGLKDPGNTTIDLFVFEVFGSVIYGNRRHNYS